MAAEHLAELKAALEKLGWRIAKEMPGDEYAISGTWELCRSGDSNVLLDFNGLDDMRTLPLTKIYGCDVRGTSHGLYFLRRGTSGTKRRARWSDELSRFVTAIGDLAG